MFSDDHGNLLVPRRMPADRIRCYGVEEAALPAVLQAPDRWLKPDGRPLPERVTAWPAPVADPVFDQSLGLWRGQPCGLDLGLIADHQVHEPIFADYPLGPDALLAGRQPLWGIDADRHAAAEARRPFRASVGFTSAQPGHVSSLAAWFDAEIASGVTLTNAPGAPSTRWRLVLPPLERPRPPPRHAASRPVLPRAGGGRPLSQHLVGPRGPWEHDATPLLARGTRGTRTGSSRSPTPESTSSSRAPRQPPVRSPPCPAL